MGRLGGLEAGGQANLKFFAAPVGSRISPHLDSHLFPRPSPSARLDSEPRGSCVVDMSGMCFLNYHLGGET